MIDLREKLAEKFHEAYERLAPAFGYETREDTRDFSPNTPNGKLMIAVCGEVIADLPDMVVPLVWYEVVSGSRYKTCQSRAGRETYTAWSNGNWRLDRTGVDGSGVAGTLEAAKSAVQAHYVAASLEPFGVQGGEA